MRVGICSGVMNKTQCSQTTQRFEAVTADFKLEPEREWQG